jgi:hypothetical protein
LSLPTSVEIAARIEELYGAPLSDLEDLARQRPPGMLSALLDGCHRLALAEQSIRHTRHRVLELVSTAALFGSAEVSHLLDATRRLAESVAVRDAQAATTAAVLSSLGRTDAPATPGADLPLPPPSPAPPLSASVPH